MNRKKIIELIQKVKCLAEKGKDGERQAAKEKLEKLCKKYNVLESELKFNIETFDYFIIVRDIHERELLINICCMILDVPGLKWKEKNNCVNIKVSKNEYEDIISAFEYYKQMYEEYKQYLIQGMISRNVIGYIPKPQNYTQENVQQDIIPVPKTEENKKEETNQKTEDSGENSEQKQKSNKNNSEESSKTIDPIKLMKIAVALDKKPWVKPLPYNKLIK